jgi:hypothetical protein
MPNLGEKLKKEQIFKPSQFLTESGGGEGLKKVWDNILYEITLTEIIRQVEGLRQREKGKQTSAVFYNEIYLSQGTQNSTNVKYGVGHSGQGIEDRS